MTKSKCINDHLFDKCKYVKKLPTVEIDLDKPPSLRWKPLIDHKDVDHNSIIVFARSYTDDIFEFYGFPRISESESYVIIAIKSFIFFMFSIIALNFEYYNDLIALAKAFNIHPGELFIANILYEFLAGCTSFICVNKDDKLKRLMHVRTLDWPMIKLNKHSTHFIFKKDKKILYHNIGWPGQLGCMTAVRQGCFSISLNARYPIYKSTFTSNLIVKLILLFRKSVKEETVEERDYIISLIDSAVASVLQKIHLMTMNAWTASSIIRHVCETYNNYEDCVKFLIENKTVCPCYFIVTGTNRHEGIIIEKGYHHLKIHKLDETKHNFIIQTNDDIDLIKNELYNSTSSTSPIDFNSTDRYCNTFEYLINAEGSLTMEEAANLITTSFKQGGVRMVIKI